MDQTVKQESDERTVATYYINLLKTKYVSYANKVVMLANDKHTFSNNEKVEDLPKPPKNYDYWRCFLQKRGYYFYSSEEIYDMYTNRLNFMEDYYRRFRLNKLTKEELNHSKPRDFKGPYLPTVSELKVLENIEIDVTSYNNRRSERMKAYLNRNHIDTVIRRWQEFQKEFGVYDLRPLIGERCAVVERNKHGVIEFYVYKLLSKHQFKNFLIYLGKNTPQLSLKQIDYIVSWMADNYINGKFQEKFRTIISGLELHLIFLLSEKYGKYLITNCLSIIIGERCSRKYDCINGSILKFCHIPFRNGPWSKEEELNLIKTLMEYHDLSDINLLLRESNKVPWLHILDALKVRSTSLMYSHWGTLKQRLLDGLKFERGELKSKWSNADTIRLINLVYKSEATTFKELKFESIVSKFPGFTDTYLKRKFSFLLNTRVPWKTRRNFNDSMEYLYHNITPVFKIKSIRENKRKERVDLVKAFLDANGEFDELFESLSYQEDERDDDEEYALLTGADCHYDDPFKVSVDKNISLEEVKEMRQIFFDKRCSGSKVYENNDIYWKRMMERANFKIKTYIWGELKDLTKLDDVTFPRNAILTKRKYERSVKKSKSLSSEFQNTKAKQNSKTTRTKDNIVDRKTLSLGRAKKMTTFSGEDNGKAISDTNKVTVNLQRDDSSKSISSLKHKSKVKKKHKNSSGDLSALSHPRKHKHSVDELFTHENNNCSIKGVSDKEHNSFTASRTKDGDAGIKAEQKIVYKDAEKDLESIRRRKHRKRKRVSEKEIPRSFKKFKLLQTTEFKID